MSYFRTLIIALAIPVFSIFWGIYFFVCCSVGTLLAFIPIGIMKISGMPETQVTQIGNDLFSVGGLLGLIFCLYTTYRFIRAVRKGKEKR